MLLKRITKLTIYIAGILTLGFVGINLFYATHLFVTSPYFRNKIIYFFFQNNISYKPTYKLVESCETESKFALNKDYLKYVCEEIPFSLIVLSEYKEVYIIDMYSPNSWNVLVHQTIIDKDPELDVIKFDSLKMEKDTGKILAFKDGQLVQMGTPFLRGNIYGIDWKDLQD